MKYKPIWKQARLWAVLVLILLFLVPSAAAFEGRSGDEVVIGANEVIEDDLYVGASRFVLNGTVKGDLFVAGERVEINGLVEGDLFAAGQAVVVNGTVTDDARVAAMAVTLGEGAEVGGDLLSAGASTEMKPGSLIGTDLILVGAQALMAGEVQRNAFIGTDSLLLSGTVGGNLEAEVTSAETEAVPFQPFMFVPNAPVMPTVPPGLTVEDSAVIGGNFEYRTRAPVNIPTGVVMGRIAEELIKVEEVPVEVAPAVLSGAWFADELRRLISLFLVGLLLLWLVPSGIQTMADAVETKPWPSLGWGLVTFFGVLVLMVVMVTLTIILASILGGVTLSGLVGTVVVIGLFATVGLGIVFGLAIAYVTKIAVSFMGGRYILARFNSPWAESRVVPFVLGLVIFVILTAVPILGGWVNFAVVLFGLGALWLIGQRMYRERRAAPAKPAPPKPAIQPTGA